MIISDLVYPYLRAQHGRVSHINTRAEFEEAYRASIQEQFENILPHLPDQLHLSLDVGGGMSGIGLLLCKYCKAKGVILGHNVLDGLHDQPTMRLHYNTFSNAEVLQKFYKANGVETVGAVSPADRQQMFDHSTPLDLVISLAAWCFHFAPDIYLRRIGKQCRRGTVMILDVRKTKPEWLGVLQTVLGSEGKIIDDQPKYTRRVWIVK